MPSPPTFRYCVVACQALSSISVLTTVVVTLFRKQGLVGAPWTGPIDLECAAPRIPVVAPTAAHHDVAPFVFDELHSLLKQWPNTYAPNGHAIVAGTVAPFTPLFHAKNGPGLPGRAAFFSFDACSEMSLGIFGGSGSSVLHTVAPTRPLRVIYFDGQSATLTETGSLDSQLAILNGQVLPNPTYNQIYDEGRRALDLCTLVDDLDLDGVVRMNAGFEILLCDWPKSGIEHLFTSNITLPGHQEREANQSLPRDPNRQPPFGFGNVFGEQGSYEWLRSATWHYGNYGQGGTAFQDIRLDPCTMVSFYDPIFKSLSGLHHGRLIGNQTFQNGWGARRGHRLVGISEADVGTFKTRLIKNTLSTGPKCSSTDWSAMAESIVSLHKTRLLDISKTFGSKKSSSFIVTRVHELSHAILYPYLQYPFASGGDVEKVEAVTVSRCSFIYTSQLNPYELSDSELLLYHSVNIVLQNLCSLEWDLLRWTERYTTHFFGEYQDLDLVQVAHELVEKWRLVQSLLSWIGWDNWNGCETQCLADELCSIPTWPVVYAPGFPQGGIYAENNTKTSEQELAEFWKPKCINRSDFDRGGGRGREPNYQLPDVPLYPC
ncbi:hypothetical protein RRF57_009593 [Xylaria bambusicola]|uniref:Uncharacterized protein n=1 Tax=Xylaria bambusicola TaxID=326684 RepID=A0AAN7UTR7_9PEZI